MEPDDRYTDDPQPGEKLNDGWAVQSFHRRRDGEWSITIISADGMNTASWPGVGDPRKSSYWKLYGGSAKGGR